MLTPDGRTGSEAELASCIILSVAANAAGLPTATEALPALTEPFPVAACSVVCPKYSLLA